MAENRPLRSDWMGTLIGLLVFLSGIGLLAITFQLAFSMFSVPPSVALSSGAEKAVDLTKAGESLATVVVRVMLLLVMCVVGSVIANRGIRLYVSCRAPAPKHEAPEPEKVKEGV